MHTAARLVQSSLHLVNDANKELEHMLEYPFTPTLASEEVSEVLSDNFPQVSSHSLLTSSPSLTSSVWMPFHVLVEGDCCTWRRARLRCVD